GEWLGISYVIVKVKLHYNRKGFIQDIVLLLEVEKGIEFKFPSSPVWFPSRKKSESSYWIFVVPYFFLMVACPKTSASLQRLPVDQSPIYRSATFADTAGGCFKSSYPNKG